MRRVYCGLWRGVLAVMAVISAVGYAGAAEAGVITDAQIKALTKPEGWRCPPNGTVPNKATVNDTVYRQKATLLHWAARRKCIDLVRRLLALQANKLLGDTDGEIPLHWAARVGADGVVAMLLQDGDSDRERMARERRWGLIPLHYVADASIGVIPDPYEHGRLSVLSLLVANCTARHLRAQLSARTKRGHTPLQIAMRSVGRSVIAAEIVGHDTCPSKPAFITQMLLHQPLWEAEQMKQIIVFASKTMCTVLAKRMAQQKYTYERHMKKFTKSITQVCNVKLHKASNREMECQERVITAEKELEDIKEEIEQHKNLTIYG